MKTNNKNEFRQLEALKELYSSMCMPEPDLWLDFTKDYMTMNTTRSGRDVFWYIDEMHCSAIYIDTLELLDEDEIERELC